MIKEIHLKDAEKNFTQLIQKSIQGEKIVILVDGKPMVMLVPYTIKNTRQLGTAKGEVIIKEGFKKALNGYK